MHLPPSSSPEAGNSALDQELLGARRTREWDWSEREPGATGRPAEGDTPVIPERWCTFPARFGELVAPGESCAHETQRAQVSEFWEAHLPILMRADGDSAFLTLNRRNGAVVSGCEPAFEETTELAASVDEFFRAVIDGWPQEQPGRGDPALEPLLQEQ
ncbi:hypothetical protein [Leucobacter luti]|uniref:hypothetical protein n=1 Tax=Leucobacter luti TaxID=340320 RepID=UPI003CFBC8FC